MKSDYEHTTFDTERGIFKLDFYLSADGLPRWRVTGNGYDITFLDRETAVSWIGGQKRSCT